MNQLQTKNDSISINTKRKYLNNGQKELMNQLIDCFKNKTVFTKDMAYEIYMNDVVRSDETWNQYYKPIYDDKKVIGFQGCFVKKEKYHYDIGFQQWFPKAIGSLVLKGYLTCMPRFDFLDVG